MELDEIVQEMKVCREIAKHQSIFNQVLEEFKEMPDDHIIFRSELTSGLVITMTKSEIKAAIKALTVVSDV